MGFTPQQTGAMSLWQWRCMLATLAKMNNPDAVEAVSDERFFERVAQGAS